MFPKRTIVLGGSRSGKSNFAESLVRQRPSPWIYLATAEARDAEMQDRIARHRARRGEGWSVIEAPKDVAAALSGADGTVLLDCATFWLTNHMLAGSDIAAETATLLAAMRDSRGSIVTVSNEVGAGIVPDTALGRRFRDEQGILNQRLAAEADLAVLIVAGLPLVLKGALPRTGAVIRLWWVRHGPTNVKGMLGWTDLPADLSDTARLDRLAAYLPDAPVISSDLSRAVATADAIARGRPRLPHDAALRELHFGDWETRHYDQIASATLTAFYDTPGDIRAPGGESWNDVCARVDAAADRLHVHGPDVIIVAHMGAILSQVQRALKRPAREVFGHKIDNLSITRIAFDDDWHAETINHLP